MWKNVGWIVLVFIIILGSYLVYPRITGMFTEIDTAEEITTVPSPTTTISVEQLSACPIEDLKKEIQWSAKNRQEEIIGSSFTCKETDTAFSLVTDASMKGFELGKFGDGWPINLCCRHGDVCVLCRNGEREGENINYLYCKTYLRLHKDIISPEGVILKKISKKVDSFVLDPQNDYRVIEINCVDV